MMLPKDWSESEYQARQEQCRARQEMLYAWAIVLAFIREHPEARQALARSMRLYPELAE